MVKSGDNQRKNSKKNLYNIAYRGRLVTLDIAQILLANMYFDMPRKRKLLEQLIEESSKGILR